MVWQLLDVYFRGRKVEHWVKGMSGPGKGQPEKMLTGYSSYLRFNTNYQVSDIMPDRSGMVTI